MTTQEIESRVFAAKFAVVRVIVAVALFAAIAATSNANAILAADEVRAAVAVEMVRSLPVMVADAH